MVSLEVGDLSPELASTPLAYISLLGLDVVNNPIHRAIWESFTANKSERALPLSLKLIPDGHEYPLAKPKRTSYDWYVPKGILKINWMSKHLNAIPAVAIQFVDLDWDTPAWLEKRAECATKLQNLRTSLQGRSTRIALVLIQKRAALPGNDDQLGAERAAFLCSSCDLSGKTLFVLPHSDHLYGYTLRLQNAFYELAQTYYNHESRRIKNHRDLLNKTTHQLLFVRHQFKIAFLSELKQEMAVALKNYKQAYANLMEVRATDANLLEIKTIAGFVNYKICRLSFLNGTPLDAIAQFRKHIDIFKSKVGCSELAFEHSAWMSKQFSHFGDLFEEAVHQNLSAIQTQHPGFYYQQAANHATMRKNLCVRLCKSVSDATNSNILAGADSMEFYGQRPWRPCCQSLEPPDPQKEQEGIQALKYKEFYDFDHSMTIIPLLSSAVSQFKKYKCPRMKRQLTVDMGEEYYYCKDYGKALTLLKHVLWDYRVEKWRNIVSSILWTALKCAYLSADVQEYISLGLEAISYWILRSSEEKTVIQLSVQSLIQGKQPGAFPGVSEEEMKTADAEWTKNLSAIQPPTIYAMQMATIIPFIECKAGFECPDYIVDQRVTVVVHIRMNCPQPMSFSKLTVLFNNPHYNQFCEVPSARGKKENHEMSQYKINLVPRNIHTYTFNFNLNPADINGEVQITSVALQLGSEDGLCTVLHWIGAGNSIGSSTAVLPFIVKAASFSDEPSFMHTPTRLTTRVIPRNAKLNVSIVHEPPVLIDEFYTFRWDIQNEEVSDIENITISVGLKPGQPQVIHDSTHLCEELCAIEKCVQYLPIISLGKLAPGEKTSKLLYLKANAVGERQILFEIQYDVEVELDDHLMKCACKKLEEVTVDVVEPFEFCVKVMSLSKCEEQTSIRAEEPFLLKLDIISCSVIPIHLEEAHIEIGKDLFSVDGNLTSVVSNLSLKHTEVGTELFTLNTNEECPSSLLLGVYFLKWRRENLASDFPPVQTVVNLPPIDVVKTPIYLELEIPAEGGVCNPMTIRYSIHNRLTTVQDVEILVDSNEYFMFSGNKQMHFRVLPRNKYELFYNLYPLHPGFVPLPKLHMTLNPQTSSALSVDDLIQDMVSTHVFIMPQERTFESLKEMQIHEV